MMKLEVFLESSEKLIASCTYDKQHIHLVKETLSFDEKRMPFLKKKLSIK